MPKGKLSDKNTTMSFAIPKTLKDEIGIISERENRSMSNLIVTLLDNYAHLYRQKERLMKYHELVSQLNEFDD